MKNTNKFTIVFIFCILFSTKLVAQKTSLIWGQLIPNEKKTYILHAAKSTSEPYFNLCQTLGMSYVTSIAAYTYFKLNEKLSVTETKKLQEKIKNNRISVIAIERTKSKLLYFYQNTNSKSDMVEYFVNAYDLSGNLISENKLYNHPIKELDNYGTAVVTSNSSKSKFLLCTRNESNNQFAYTVPKLLFAVCDSNGKKINGKSIDYKTETSGGIISFDNIIDEDGNVFIAYKKYSSTKSKESIKDESTKQKVVGYTLNVAKITPANIVSKTVIEDKDYVFHSKLAFVPNSKNVVCVYFCGVEKDNDIESISSALLDENAKILSNKKSDLPTLENVLCKNRETYLTDLLNIHFCSDGNYFVVSEQNSSPNILRKDIGERSKMESSSSINNTSPIADVSYGITYFLFDSKGNVIQSKVIPRIFANRCSNYYNGVFSEVINDKLYLVYNAIVQEPKNNVKGLGSLFLGDYGTILNIVDNKANITRKVLFQYTGTNTLLIPTLSNKIEGNNLLLFNSVFKDYGVKKDFDLPSTYRYAKLKIE